VIGRCPRADGEEQSDERYRGIPES
jgi:hypothetical protein